MLQKYYENIVDVIIEPIIYARQRKLTCGKLNNYPSLNIISAFNANCLNLVEITEL